MGIIIKAHGNEPLPSGRYRVKLVAIERTETDYGDVLKWVFIVLGEPHTVVGYTPVSGSIGSKCMRWISALLNRRIQPNEEVDLDTLLGRTAIAGIFYRKHCGEEYNEVAELIPDN
jgi:hypothetical protein